MMTLDEFGRRMGNERIKEIVEMLYQPNPLLEAFEPPPSPMTWRDTARKYLGRIRFAWAALRGRFDDEYF